MPGFHRFLTGLAALVVLAVSASAAMAFRVEPISLQFTPDGRGASQSITIQNTTSAPIAVQISVFTRAIDENGVESRDPAPNDFLFFPPQVALEPGQSQVVRFQWGGTRPVTQELAYRFIAEQLQLDLDPLEGQSGVRVLLRYEGTIYVAPQGAEPELIVGEITREGGSMVFNVWNTGGRHALILDGTLTVTSSGGQSVTLTADQLEGLVGENILAGGIRRVELPWPAGLTGSGFTVSFEASVL